jgi:hypothetical protein
VGSGKEIDSLTGGHHKEHNRRTNQLSFLSSSTDQQNSIHLEFVCAGATFLSLVLSGRQLSFLSLVE